jgi:hypothetical protein
MPFSMTYYFEKSIVFLDWCGYNLFQLVGALGLSTHFRLGEPFRRLGRAFKFSAKMLKC